MGDEWHERYAAWGFLDDRFRALRGQTHHVLPEGEGDGRLWLQLQLRQLVAADDKRVSDCREAMLLVGAMGSYARTDVWEVWMAKLPEFAEVSEVMDGHPWWKVVSRFDVMSVPGQTFAEWEAAMRQLLWTETTSETFNEDWNQMCELLEEEGIDMSQPPVIPVRFAMSVDESQDPDAQTRQIRGMIQFLTQLISHLEELERVFPNRPRFKLDSVDLNLRSLILTPVTVQSVQELLALKVQVQDLILPVDFPTHVSWRRPWASLLHTVCGNARSTLTTAYPIGRIIVSFTTEPMYRAFCSTIVDAVNVKGIKVTGCFNPVAFSWNWLYFALFSQASTSSVASVFLNYDHCFGRTSDTDTVKTKDPLSQLLNDPIRSSSDMELGSVRLREGASVRLFPFEGEVEETIVIDKPVDIFEILRGKSTSTTVDILVPGFGNGRVDRSAILDILYDRQAQAIGVVHAASQDKSRTQNAMKRLYIVESASDEITSQLLRLLTFAGSRIESIRLFSTPSSGSYVRELLAKCSNLTSLELIWTTASILDGILTAYDRGSTLRNLSFQKWREYDDSSMRAFLQRLSDPSSSLTRHLQRLDLHGYGELSIAWQPTDTTARLFATMLQKNTQLHWLQVFLGSRAYTAFDQAMDECEPQEREKALKRIVGGVPLSVRTKCAFLSVFSHDSSRLSDISFNVDMLVVSKIFEFAEEPIRRRVGVHEWESYDDDDDEDDGGALAY
ncbi:hypothetical protein Poli38472_011176 [Pythium oligandrum]|uniref:Uncharacterized protein n=1 Tax=Pythium oligandrum TaxID=41045 RepID=A0A8K1CRX7_PYTOL|nr:hypothetical protein Poli38472_011176 [Pythium oligandrum]|eukprot:TMW67556.1 hypothetical protein Poli38472_011176 [Pythium oligandrum]